MRHLKPNKQNYIYKALSTYSFDISKYTKYNFKKKKKQGDSRA